LGRCGQQKYEQKNGGAEEFFNDVHLLALRWRWREFSWY
jgi:hypothetical protein